MVSPEQEEGSSRPDHCYFIILEFHERQSQLRNYTTMPSFRGGLSHDGGIISCPPYLITEEKASTSSEVEFRQYLAFIASFLLYERLLLRQLKAKAHKSSEIPIDESLCVYAMTNCGQKSTIYKMAVRMRDRKSNVNKPVRFDFVKIRDLVLTTRADCDELKLLVNLIHYWGSTVHMPAIMAEGLEASQSEIYINGGWRHSLSRQNFCYTMTGLAFTALPQNLLGLPAPPVYGD